MSLEEKNTLYNQLGGRDAIEAAVDIFYEKVMADPRINYFFKDMDMTRQRAHQKAFLTYAVGGAPDYQGRSLRKAHKPLTESMGLNDAHFDAFMENLRLALLQVNTPSHLLMEVLDIVESSRDDILNR